MDRSENLSQNPLPLPRNWTALKPIRLIIGALLVCLALGAFWFSSGQGRPGEIPNAAAENGLAFSNYLPLVKKPPLPTVFGVDMGPITEERGLDLLDQNGLYWLRRGSLSWAAVEATEGVRDWSAVAGLELELIRASQAGAAVILIVQDTPDWAQLFPGVTCGPIRQNKLDAFASFAHEAVQRYSQPPYNVRYWEIWNEPGVDPARLEQIGFDLGFGCWGNPADPYYGGGYYAEMLSRVTPQIKAADPQAQVLHGGLLLECDPYNPPAGRSCEESLFLEGVLRGGGGPYFDGISFHAYDYYYASLGIYRNDNWSSAWNTTPHVAIPKAAFVRNVLNAYGWGNKYLMNTEAALVCGDIFDPPGQPPCEEDPQSEFEQTKAYYAAQSYAVALREGFQANVWYSLFGWRNTDLLNGDLTPRPAFTSLTFARAELQDATYLRDLSEYPTTFGYEFHRGDRRVWLLWSADGNPQAITLPGLPLQAYDVYGDAVAVPTPQIVATSAPLYLEWPP